MMERISADNLDNALYRRIGIICARDEAMLDMRHGSAVAVGYNEGYQTTVRSHFETINGERKVWHSIGLVDKNQPTKFRFCKISEKGDIFYSDSQEAHQLREMSIADSRDFSLVMGMLEELYKVEWLPQAQIGEAESELPRFNL